MKTNIVMKLKCNECKTKFNIANNEIDDYCIYYTLDGNGTKFNIPTPKLICPSCLESGK